MRKIVRFHIVTIMLTALWVMCAGRLSFARIMEGEAAPAFSLKDLGGETYDLSQMGDRPMVILYFFDVESRPSQEGLLSLNELAGKYEGSDLTVWAITRSPREGTSSFVKKTDLAFPVLLDTEKVSDLYQARMILPTVCIIGPGLKVLDHFQGGGKTTEVMLVRLAERELQRKQPKIAKAISKEVMKKNPDNVKAGAVGGYAALKEGKFEEAENFFRNLSQKGGDGGVLGKEGLAALYAKKNQPEKAMQLAKEVEKEAPKRSYVHVIKGDLLYAQGKKKEAVAEYQHAVDKEEAEPYQNAVRHNKLGRVYASAGQYQKARDQYDKAVTIDPYYIEGTTNKGMTYEKEGRWDKALESYNQALASDKNDTIALVLAKKAREMLDLQKDIDRKKRIDRLVKELAERYRSQKEAAPKIEDTWTSRPMVISFVDFQEKGGLSERDGIATVLTAQLADLLNASGRVRVVERVLIDRLLEELNLGSSELADPETALRLGKVLAAKLIGTGSLYYLPQENLLSLRLIDAETSAIPQVTTKQLSLGESLEKELFELNREILKTVIMKYPLQGYLVKVDGDQSIVNLGSQQGVVPGTKFDVLEEQEPIEYKGKVLKSSPKSVAQVEVVRVEPDLCYVKVLKKDRPLKADDMVQERIEEAAL